MASPTHSDSTRWGWLDQFRGYTVLAMFVVNFVGSYPCSPAQLKHHHTYCNFADTIMPQFLFMVGVGYRLTFMRRLEKNGWANAVGHAISRNLSLLVVALVVHGLGQGVSSWAQLNGPELGPALTTAFKRTLFQTLTHIAVTSLWVLPVIALGVAPRLLFALACAVLHATLSRAGYYSWVNTNPVGIDGGPLGFLTWTTPLLVGSIAADYLGKPGGGIAPMALLSLMLMLLGYAVSCLNRWPAPGETHAVWSDWLNAPPFFPPTHPVDMWTMSQRSGSVSYLVFSAGFALMVAILFVLIERRLGWSWGVFTTLGINALAGYILHDWIGEAVKPFTPRDAPLWYVSIATGVFLTLCYLFLRHMQKKNLIVRL